MTDMGPYFETPKISNRRLWVLMQALAEAGYRFHTEASRALLFGAPKTDARIPSTRATMLRIQAWLAAHEPSTPT